MVCASGILWVPRSASFKLGVSRLAVESCKKHRIQWLEATSLSERPFARRAVAEGQKMVTQSTGREALRSPAAWTLAPRLCREARHPWGARRRELPHILLGRWAASTGPVTYHDTRSQMAVRRRQDNTRSACAGLATSSLSSRALPCLPNRGSVSEHSGASPSTRCIMMGRRT